MDGECFVLCRLPVAQNNPHHVYGEHDDDEYNEWHDEGQRLARACDHLRASILHRLCACLKFFGALLALLHQPELFALQCKRFSLPLELQTLIVANFLQQRNDASGVCFGHDGSSAGDRRLQPAEGPGMGTRDAAPSASRKAFA